MIQYEIKIDGKLANCPSCGRQPRVYGVRGKEQRLLECAPCGIRTAKLPTMQEAVAMWERQETQPVRARA